MKKRSFKRTGQFHVYILRCKDDTFYTGSTNNLEKRIKLHNKGNGSKYVRSKRPVTLAYAKVYRYYKNAITAEREIKKLSRIKKEELVNGYKNNRKFAKKIENPKRRKVVVK